MLTDSSKKHLPEGNGPPMAIFNAFHQLRDICEWHFPSPLSLQYSQLDMIAVGADLSPSTLLKAYSNGLFPWYEKRPIQWWSPNPRCVFFPKLFQPSKSLKRFARSSNWTITISQAFSDVIDACALPRKGENGSWLHEEVRTAYKQLFELGFGYSVDVWEDTSLVGGLYGVKIGGAVFGESMFSRQSNASKIGLWFLMRLCVESKIELVDAQVENPHTLSLGAKALARPHFIQHVADSIEQPHCWKEFTSHRYPCRLLNDPHLFEG